MSQKNTPELCEGVEKNFFLKSQGMRGIIVAVSVVGVAFIIIVLSKLNEIRLHKVPYVWRGKLKSMVKDSVNSLKMARETSNIGTSHKYALEASITLADAKRLVGTSDLGKISGFDVSKLESEIDSLLRRNIPSDLLIEKSEEGLFHKVRFGDPSQSGEKKKIRPSKNRI